MSLPVFTWVLDHSEERLGNRLTLLALAEHSHDDGSKAYPSNETLQKRTRLSERSVRDALRSLEANGSIRQTGTLRNGTRVYMVIGPFNPAESAPAKSAPPADRAAEPAKSAPKPSRTPKGSTPPTTGRAPQSVDGKRVTVEEHDLADAVLAAFNEISGKRFGGKEWRRAIIMRIREHPDLAAADHRSIIEFQMAHPWWKDDPTPAVIYGKGSVFDRALNGVRGVGDNVPDEQDDPYARGAESAGDG